MCIRDRYYSASSDYCQQLQHTPYSRGNKRMGWLATTHSQTSVLLKGLRENAEYIGAEFTFSKYTFVVLYTCVFLHPCLSDKHNSKGSIRTIYTFK